MQRRRLWLVCLKAIGHLLGPSPLRQAGSSVSSLGRPKYRTPNPTLLPCSASLAGPTTLSQCQGAQLPSHLPVTPHSKMSICVNGRSSHLAEACLLVASTCHASWLCWFGVQGIQRAAYRYKYLTTCARYHS
ncbi:hypothetical protein B0T20DRAFT_403212 [Sordaria brevicollis]|uniref:Secreted protein n=1 Tax=Sordaria brevicollis TaxID=83679 RepID=A0AAE0UF72_SORBR|nr:hypothetical protein B0T20DRAFT_403212 [Sordaria brevicollis]